MHLFRVANQGIEEASSPVGVFGCAVGAGGFLLGAVRIFTAGSSMFATLRAVTGSLTRLSGVLLLGFLGGFSHTCLLSSRMRSHSGVQGQKISWVSLPFYRIFTHCNHHHKKGAPQASSDS